MIKRIINYRTFISIFRIGFIIVAVYMISLICMGTLNLFNNENLLKLYLLLLEPILLLSIIAFVFLIIACILKMLPNHGYGTNTALNGWYEATMKVYGKGWTDNITQKLIEIGLISEPVDDKAFVLISPSANQGTYEKQIFDSLCKRKICSHVIASDIEVLHKHELSSEYQYGRYTYLDGSYDAANLKIALNDSGESAANIIWDFKGYLWHSINEVVHNKKNINYMISIFEQYNKQLKNSGCIIFDNIQGGSLFKRFLYQWIYTIFGYRLKFIAEYSTNDKLQKLLNSKNGNLLLDYISDTYNIIEVGCISDNHTEIKVIAFQIK